MRERRALDTFFLHRECGYQFTSEGRVQELTRPEVNELWAGYTLWMQHVNPETAGANEKDQGDFDEKGRYRGSGAARNAGKPSAGFNQKYERFKREVNA